MRDPAGSLTVSTDPSIGSAGTASTRLTGSGLGGFDLWVLLGLGGGSGGGGGAGGGTTPGSGDVLVGGGGPPGSGGGAAPPEAVGPPAAGAPPPVPTAGALWPGFAPAGCARPPPTPGGLPDFVS